jgi:hypothetical protein
LGCYKSYRGRVNSDVSDVENVNEEKIVDQELESETSFLSTIKSINETINLPNHDAENTSKTMVEAMNDIADFNAQVKDTSGEQVCDINVRQLGKVIHMNENASLKTIAELLIGSMDDDSAESTMHCSSIGDAKRMKSRQNRWFSLSKPAEDNVNHELCRGTILSIFGCEDDYKILCLHQKSYNKFRLIRSLSRTDEGIIIVQKIQYCSFNHMFRGMSEFKKV